MPKNLAQDWPVYILSVAVICFFIFVIINGNMQEKKDKSKEDKKEGQK